VGAALPPSANAQPASPRQIKPVANTGADRDMSDRPLSYLIAHPRY
jgi:hypothetical protein